MVLFLCQAWAEALFCCSNVSVLKLLSSTKVLHKWSTNLSIEQLVCEWLLDGEDSRCLLNFSCLVVSSMSCVETLLNKTMRQDKAETCWHPDVIHRLQRECLICEVDDVKRLFTKFHIRWFWNHWRSGLFLILMVVVVNLFKTTFRTMEVIHRLFAEHEADCQGQPKFSKYVCQ